MSEEGGVNQPVAPRTNNSPKILLLVLLLVLVAGVFWGVFYFIAKKPSLPPSATQSSQENLDLIIKNFVLANAAQSITDVVVTKKKFYTDSQKTQWLQFNVSPIPPNAADPAYGVMKKPVGENWQGVDFGTCCIEENLPADVRQGLGFE